MRNSSRRGLSRDPAAGPPPRRAAGRALAEGARRARAGEVQHGLGKLPSRLCRRAATTSSPRARSSSWSSRSSATCRPAPRAATRGAVRPPRAVLSRRPRCAARATAAGPDAEYREEGVRWTAAWSSSTGGFSEDQVSPGSRWPGGGAGPGSDCRCRTSRARRRPTGLPRHRPGPARRPRPGSPAARPGC